MVLHAAAWSLVYAILPFYRMVKKTKQPLNLFNKLH